MSTFFVCSDDNIILWCTAPESPDCRSCEPQGRLTVYTSYDLLTTTFFVFYVGDQLLYIEEHTETVRGCVHDTFGGMTGIFNV